MLPSMKSIKNTGWKACAPFKTMKTIPLSRIFALLCIAISGCVSHTVGQKEVSPKSMPLKDLLRQTIIPKIDFQEITYKEAVEILSAEVRKATGRDIKVIINDTVPVIGIPRTITDTNALAFADEMQAELKADVENTIFSINNIPLSLQTFHTSAWTVLGMISDMTRVDDYEISGDSIIIPARQEELVLRKTPDEFIDNFPFVFAMRLDKKGVEDMITYLSYDYKVKLQKSYASTEMGVNEYIILKQKVYDQMIKDLKKDKKLFQEVKQRMKKKNEILKNEILMDEIWIK